MMTPMATNAAKDKPPNFVLLMVETPRSVSNKGHYSNQQDTQGLNRCVGFGVLVLQDLWLMC
jgi:hypothetical protein